MPTKCYHYLMQQLPVILVIDNVRSAFNVGSLWRTADAVGAERIILLGISPHPSYDNDARLPHIASEASKLIAKTALGAEQSLPFDYYKNANDAVSHLRQQGYTLCSLEQTPASINLFEYKPVFPLALFVGHETTGLHSTTLALTDNIIAIPQFGQKESLNVSVAAGIALYFLRDHYQKAFPKP